LDDAGDLLLGRLRADDQAVKVVRYGLAVMGVVITDPEEPDEELAFISWLVAVANSSATNQVPLDFSRVPERLTRRFNPQWVGMLLDRVLSTKVQHIPEATMSRITALALGEGEMLAAVSPSNRMVMHDKHA
jgi:hypothetical protein